MSSPFDEQDDATMPLDAEEKEALIPSYITTHGELNAAEQANIFDAEESAFTRKRDTLSERFLDDLHKRRCTWCVCCSAVSETVTLSPWAKR